MTEDAVVGWHHQLSGHRSEQALGVGDGQRSLACFSPQGRKSRTQLSVSTDSNQYDVNQCTENKLMSGNYIVKGTQTNLHTSLQKSVSCFLKKLEM